MTSLTLFWSCMTKLFSYMDTKKLYKKIQKKHIFGAVISFIVFTVILVAILAFIAYEFAAYLVDTKLASVSYDASLAKKEKGKK